jgi:hypothetical protein
MDLNEFSDKYHAERVSGYIASCTRLNDHHWREILDACGLPVLEPSTNFLEDEAADLSLLDQRHGMLFEFSSPIKA